MADKTCANCGRALRDKDRFCIYCGSPQIVDISKSKKKNKKESFSDTLKKGKDKKKGKKKESVPFESGDKSPPAEPIEDDLDFLEEDKKKEKAVPFADEEDFIPEDLSITDDIREQLESKMELALIKYKKEKLLKKYKEIMEDAKSERYEHDIDFAQGVNIRLDAFKEVQKELKEKEEELKSKIGLFKFDELNKLIEMKRAQLTELKRKYKLHKINESIFQQLKREYASEYRKAQRELADFQKQMRIWVSKLKSEKNREEIKLKILEGRHAARELSKEDLNQQKKDHIKAIETLEQKILVLRNFTGK